MTRYIDLEEAKKVSKKDFYPPVDDNKRTGQEVVLANFNGKTEKGTVALRRKADYGTPDYMKAY